MLYEIYKFIIYLLSFFIFIFIGIIVHELGHLVFGLLSGYSFISFRIGPFVWSKEGNRLKFNMLKSPIIGQCLMEPVDNYEDFKYLLYNMGGGIFNLLFGLVLFIIKIRISNQGVLNSFLFGGTVSSLYLGFVNLYPRDGAYPNDGLNIKMTRKSEEGKWGLYVQLKVNSLLSRGLTLMDIDESYFYLDEKADTSNYLVAYIISLKADRYFEIGEPKKAIELYDELEIDKLSNFYKYNILSDILYYYLVYDLNPDKVEEMLKDKGFEKHLQLELPINKRIKIAYEYFIKKDYEKAGKLIIDLKETTKNYYNKGSRIMEEKKIKELEDMMGEFI